MSKTKKNPPMKLAWAEACQDWISRPDIDTPPRISKPLAQAIVLRLMLSAANDGTGVLASPKWMAKKVGTHHTRVLRFLRHLVDEGWLARDGEDRTTRAARYRLTIPQEGDQGSPLPTSPGGDQRSPFPKPTGGTRGGTNDGTSGPPLPTSEEVEESGASAPLTLSVAEVGRLRGVLEQVAANRSAVDVHGFNERNAHLQQEWHRLDGGGWDARKIDVALPHPRSIKSSDTGWLLSQFRDLHTDPDDEPSVVEAEMLLYAWLSSWVNDDEELAQCGISSEEFDRLEGVSVTHGYGLEDGTWTEKGSKLSRQVRDPDLDLSEMDDDPRWVLVRQALEVKSMKA